MNEIDNTLVDSIKMILKAIEAAQSTDKSLMELCKALRKRTDDLDFRLTLVESHFAAKKK